MTVGRIPSVEGGIQPTLLDAKGDLITAIANDTPARLALGTTGQVLKVNTATATGLEWAADSAGMTNPMTTTGDTIYSSSGSTPARRAIGTTGQVLTVSGGIPVWATPATPSTALTLSTIASGSLTSGTSLNLTGLTQDFLQLRVDGLTFGGSNDGPLIKINGAANSHTYNIWDYAASSAAYSYINSAQVYFTNAFQTRTDAGNMYIITLENCKATGFTTFTTQAYYNGGGTARGSVTTGVFSSAAQVTSLLFQTANSQTFSAGSYSLIGG